MSLYQLWLPKVCLWGSVGPSDRGRCKSKSGKLSHQSVWDDSVECWTVVYIQHLKIGVLIFSVWEYGKKIIVVVCAWKKSLKPRDTWGINDTLILYKIALIGSSGEISLCSTSWVQSAQSHIQRRKHQLHLTQTLLHSPVLCYLKGIFHFSVSHEEVLVKHTHTQIYRDIEIYRSISQ